MRSRGRLELSEIAGGPRFFELAVGVATVVACSGLGAEIGNLKRRALCWH